MYAASQYMMTHIESTPYRGNKKISFTARKRGERIRPEKRKEGTAKRAEKKTR